MPYSCPLSVHPPRTHTPTSLLPPFPPSASSFTSSTPSPRNTRIRPAYPADHLASQLGSVPSQLPALEGRTTPPPLPASRRSEHRTRTIRPSIASPTDHRNTCRPSCIKEARHSQTATLPITSSAGQRPRFFDSTSLHTRPNFILILVLAGQSAKPRGFGPNHYCILGRPSLPHTHITTTSHPTLNSPARPPTLFYYGEEHIYPQTHTRTHINIRTTDTIPVC